MQSELKDKIRNMPRPMAACYASQIDAFKDGYETARKDALRAIAAWNTRAEGDAWTPISMDMPTDAPLDVPLLLAWKDWDGTLVMEVGLAGSTRGGWRHGQATHWRPLVEFPAELKNSTGEGN